MNVRLRWRWKLAALPCALALGCEDSAVAPPEPSGPEPEFTVSIGFGDPPVQGFARLSPSPESLFWRYSIDIDEDGSPDRSGVLGQEIDFAYTFSSVGVHRIRAELVGPSGAVTRERVVVVNDPGDGIQVLAQRRIDQSSGFEGIAVDRSGDLLFASDFGLGRIHPLSTVDLSPLASPLEVQTGPEGLAVIPSDSLLLVSHKRFYFTVIALPSLEIRRVIENPGGSFVSGFFVRALTDERALVGTSSGFRLLSIEDGTTLAEAPFRNAWHFAVSPDGQTLALTQSLEGAADSLHVLTLPDLTRLLSFRLPVVARIVAFDPDGQLHVLGWDEDFDWRFLVVDPMTGEVGTSMVLESQGCILGFCAANPAAVSSSGRYIAFEQFPGIIIVDTEVDLPLYRFEHAGSVAAAPTGDVFFVLQSDGLVSKIAIEPSAGS
ncbi:MAG: hypothetical protein ACRELU_01315 [Gemmatimonadota bacterium]